ncbi:Protein of unknown function [Actinacidiphila yanglinensis]|uniref:DUF2637 domain-containing protein n=1 Tax=Actinacidiphila yanglinensis TaxID=310779 RepID=A0A1H6BZ72_9ACTN|nr:DUF2637 domain-containing protein [Actinacidiphila yanglinensis]SEG65777.1 Protein of unknown function [Actinacidiphila yanglinensis]
MAAIRLTRTHRILIGIVVSGAVVIAGIGFAGSYAAVRTLALHKGFGWFANVFPIGVDAGIVVLLSLDLLLTWLRIPFPLLRQTAWLLTAATIAFNGAAAWPDPLGVGMHAIIPVLFVVSVEAARHAIGRIADITADKHMEGVRLTRWLLAPVPTFRLWRRMKLWELRSYEEVIRREQDRLVYRARLRARYGVAWRRRAPVEAIMPLRLARYGVPLSETAEAGLEAAGIEIAPAAKQLTAASASAPADSAPVESVAAGEQAAGASAEPTAVATAPARQPVGPAGEVDQEFDLALAQAQEYERQLYERRLYEQQGYPQDWQGAPHDSPWFAAQQAAQAQGHPYPYGQAQYAGPQQPFDPQGVPGQDVPPQPFVGQEQHPQQQVMVPAGPNRTRPLGNVGTTGDPVNGANGGNGAGGLNGAGGVNGHGEANGFAIPGPRSEEPGQVQQQAAAPVVEVPIGSEPETELVTYPSGTLRLPDEVPVEEAYFAAYRQYVREQGTFPNARQLARLLEQAYGGSAPEERELVAAHRELRYRFSSEAETEYIP